MLKATTDIITEMTDTELRNHIIAYHETDFSFDSLMELLVYKVREQIGSGPASEADYLHGISNTLAWAETTLDIADSK